MNFLEYCSSIVLQAGSDLCWIMYIFNVVVMCIRMIEFLKEGKSCIWIKWLEMIYACVYIGLDIF